MTRTFLLTILVLTTATLASPQTQPTTSPAAALYDRIAPSLVVVQFTYDGELGRRELDGIGVVVRDDGLVMASMGMTPVQVPDEQMKDFKIILHDDDQTELDATFQGRDERTGVTFVKVKDTSRSWTPVKFEDVAVDVGDRIYSIGLLPKDSGYKPYLCSTTVAANLRGPVPQVLVNAEGLSWIGSPVFNDRGVALGFVNSQPDQSAILNDPRNPMGAVLQPPRLYTPAKDFLQSISDPPIPGTPVKLPSIGVAQLSGLKKEVAEYFGLKDEPAIQVGDVIPDFPAAQAGLKSGDVIVKLNGKALERGDQPEEIPMIMTRKISRMRVGDTVTLSVLRDKDKPLEEIKVTLRERPKPANKAGRFWAEDLGFATRELVFEDTYRARLPADTKGVMVALIKPGSAAQTAKLAGGDLVTKINQTPVESLDQFKKQYEQFRKEQPKEAVVLEALRGVNTQVIRIEPPQ